MTALSVHIGLNRVDPGHYAGWDGELAACENDARSMEALAKEQGFTSSPPLLSAQATSASVIAAIGAAAHKLAAGDMFFLTYSGHGGQVANTNPKDDPEADRLDETWCLFDREMLDDELHALYSQFKAGVRVVVFSDSCHSGTVTRAREDGRPNGAKQPPADVAKATAKLHAAMYDQLQRDIPSKRLQRPKADVVLISGCQDDQFSRDGDANGAFTGALLDAWKQPGARHSLRALCEATTRLIPADFDQTPNYYVLGDIAGPALTP